MTKQNLLWIKYLLSFLIRKMPITTDKVSIENGTDFTFVCRKIPFAISCTSDLPHGDTNLIDLDLINKMRIPLRNIRVTRMSLLGHDVRAVGRIRAGQMAICRPFAVGNKYESLTTSRRISTSSPASQPRPYQRDGVCKIR